MCGPGSVNGGGACGGETDRVDSGAVENMGLLAYTLQSGMDERAYISPWRLHLVGVGVWDALRACRYHGNTTPIIIL